MADTPDFSKMSDEELDNFIKNANVTAAPPGAGSKVATERRGAVAEKAERLAGGPSIAEQIEPSALKRGAAALGGALLEPIAGATEKFQLVFPGASPEARAETLRRVQTERGERRKARKELEETTAGQFGSFLGSALPAAAAPQRIPFQMGLAGLEGFLGGGPNVPEGLLNELATSGFSGGLGAGTTGGAMSGIQLAGKAASGMRGQYTPEGAKAMELEAAARRLGLPSTTIGQLDPLAPEAIRAHPELAIQQARAMEDVIAGRRTVPSPAGGMEEQIVPGGRLKEGLKEAVNVRRQQARDMYTAVDDFAAAQGLDPITPNYTINTLSSINKKLTAGGKQPTGNNLVFNLLDTYDPDAFMWLKKAGSPQTARQQGMSMTEYHDARVAVNRALNSLERKNPVDLTSDQIEAKRLLIDLKTALDSDVERWSKQNAGNEEAMALYNRAKNFYATTASEAINNPLSRKLMSQSRGFVSPEQMYSAVINPANRTLVERLMPTASPETRDVVNVLQNLPDVGAVVARGQVPSGGASRELGALVRGAMGHPGLSAMELAPGLRWLSTTQPAKRTYFGRVPTGRWQGPAAQYPAGALETMVREITRTDQNQ